MFCQVTKIAMQDLPKASKKPVLRTLQSMHDNLKAFQADGSRLPRAKMFQNVIRPALLQIPLEWVCIPSLHLDLGIYLWLYEAMISDLRDLDVAMAAEIGKSGMDEADSVSFAEAAQLNSDISETMTKRNLIKDQAEVIRSQVRY